MRYFLAGAVLSLCAMAASAQFNASLKTLLEWNDHIEFGISVDPETVTESSSTGQLIGLRASLSAPIEYRQGGGRFQWRAAFAPSLDDYAGEDGFLDQFDARLFPLDASVEFRPRDSLPALRWRASAHRQERSNELYDNWNASTELGIGNLLSYQYRRRLYDDSIEREDYLLISSVQHQLQTGFQIITRREARLKATYTFQREQYGTNLHPLLRDIALGVKEGFRRVDRRHQGSLEAAALLGRGWLLRLSASAMRADSNAAFYRFTNGSAGATLFWGSSANRWARAQIVHGSTWFAERGAQDRRRVDTAWQLNLDGELPLYRFLSANGAVNLRINRTNDGREALRFLNHTQQIYRLALTARR